MSYTIFSTTVPLLNIGAFVSSYIQANHLIMDQGLIPLSFLKKKYQGKGLWFILKKCPSLFMYLGGSKQSIDLVCLMGIFFSILSFLDVFRFISTFMCIVCLGSFNLVGRNFYQEMDFQLVESNLVILISEPSIKLLNTTWIFYLLSLFFVGRLFYSCGLWKFYYGYTDCWRDIESETPSLPNHFETMPQPTPVAKIFYRFPKWFHKISIYSVFFIQVIAPPMLFLFWYFDLVKLLVAFSFGSLQILIGLTGNFAWLSILSFLMSLNLLSDQQVCSLFWVCPQVIENEQLSVLSYMIVIVWTLPLASFYLVFSVAAFLSKMPLINRFPLPAKKYVNSLLDIYIDHVEPLKLINTYRKFVDVCSERCEFQIEGYNGFEWLEFEFHYKVGDLKKVPKFQPLHIPRVDWQVWLLAQICRDLGNVYSIRNHLPDWFRDLLDCCLKMDTSIVNHRLFKTIPFNVDKPPQRVRLALYKYEYEFESDSYWKRKKLCDIDV